MITRSYGLQLDDPGWRRHRGLRQHPGALRPGLVPLSAGARGGLLGKDAGARGMTREDRTAVTGSEAHIEERVAQRTLEQKDRLITGYDQKFALVAAGPSA